MGFGEGRGFSPVPIPPEKTLYLPPIGAGDTTQLTKVGAATNWECCVDSEDLDDGIATYVTGGVSDYFKTDTYLMAEATGTAGYKIDKLYVEIWTATNYHTGAQLYPQLVVNGTTIEGPWREPVYFTPATFWSLPHFPKETWEFAVDDEGNPWTFAKLAGIQAGMRLRRGTLGVVGVSKVHIRLYLVRA